MALLRPEASAGDVVAALDGQTARLDMANGRVADLIAIAEACDSALRRTAAGAR